MYGGFALLDHSLLSMNDEKTKTKRLFVFWILVFRGVNFTVLSFSGLYFPPVLGLSFTNTPGKLGH